MTTARPHIEQTDPPRSPRETLPTMYDLPSEDPEESGLPDEFHDFQPQLLSATFRLTNYTQDRVFTASDLNLYYDINHPRWYKRPDWFAVAGVSRWYDGKDLRLSYVIWQEGISPHVVVELLSPGTEKEDLGQTKRGETEPPTKWEVYEQILRVPYYVIFDRYTDRLQAFKLDGYHYQPIDLSEPRFWMADLKIGLGLWQGTFQGVDRLWLRWYDSADNWILTEPEQERQRADRERQRADQERQRADRLADLLRSQGINPDELD